MLYVQYDVTLVLLRGQMLFLREIFKYVLGRKFYHFEFRTVGYYQNMLFLSQTDTF